MTSKDNILFSDMFDIKDVDGAGKKFDKGNEPHWRLVFRAGRPQLITMGRDLRQRELRRHRIKGIIGEDTTPAGWNAFMDAFLLSQHKKPPRCTGDDYPI